MKLYTIQRNSTIISVNSSNIKYFIGYKNILFARKVLYNLHPEYNENIYLLKDQNKIIKKNDIIINYENNATLFIPKYIGSYNDPMNDGGFHINYTPLNIINEKCGLIIPFKLLDENENELIFKVHLINFNYQSM